MVINFDNRQKSHASVYKYRRKIKRQWEFWQKSDIRLDFCEEDELAMFLRFMRICCLFVRLWRIRGFRLLKRNFFVQNLWLRVNNSSLVEVARNSVEFVAREYGWWNYITVWRKLFPAIRYRTELIELGRKNVKRFSWKNARAETLEKYWILMLEQWFVKIKNLFQFKRKRATLFLLY